MNRFVLDMDPAKAAEYHCDRHCIKMILEECQMLSTAHRVLDGIQYEGQSKSGRKTKRWKLDDQRDKILYQATHINHPCTQWSMLTAENYFWSMSLLRCLLDEYQYRYGKKHKCEELYPTLNFLPQKIENGVLTPFPQAMPDQYKVANNSVASYRNYYIGAKSGFAKWKNREIPPWFVTT